MFLFINKERNAKYLVQGHYRVGGFELSSDRLSGRLIGWHLILFKVFLILLHAVGLTQIREAGKCLTD